MAALVCKTWVRLLHHNAKSLQVMTGHRKEITSLSIHPSGKLALSTSRDSTLRIWDLIKGRCSYHHILDSVAEVVAFSPSGSLYALVAGSKVTIHKIGQEAGLAGELKHSRRVLCMAWDQDDVLLTGTEAGSIHTWNVSSATQICETAQAHQTRIRGLVVSHQHTASQPASSESPVQLPESHVQRQCTIASAASDGSVKLWQLKCGSQDGTLHEVSQVRTGARLTCLSFVQPMSCMPEAGKQPSKAKQGKKRMSKAPHEQVKKQKRTGPAPANARARQAVAPKSDLLKVGVAKNGVVDFTVDAKSGMQDSSKPVMHNKTPRRHGKVATRL